MEGAMWHPDEVACVQALLFSFAANAPARCRRAERVRAGTLLPATLPRKDPASDQHGIARPSQNSDALVSMLADSSSALVSTALTTS